MSYQNVIIGKPLKSSIKHHLLKKLLSFILLFTLLHSSYGQDSMTPDTTAAPDKHSTIGINISPIAVQLLGGETGYQKWSIQFRKCLGFAVFRANANLTMNPQDPWSDDWGGTIYLSDTTRSISTTLNAVVRKDLRFGFEKDWGWENMKFSLGADLIGGRTARRTIFINEFYDVDQVNNLLQISHVESEGINMYFYKIGFDLSMGIEFKLSDSFNLTAQWTPEWNYYLLDKSRPYKEEYLPSVEPSIWMDIGPIIDLYLSYKF